MDMVARIGKFPLLALSLAILIGGLTLFLQGGVFLNIFTHSLPQGIYLRKAGEPQKGEYALTCLNQNIVEYGLKQGYLRKGTCKTGIIPVAKIIKGIPGDRFLIHNDIMFIYDEQFPLAQTDSLGRPLDKFYQDGEHVLKDGEYLLISDYASDSWDSRYWGPVSVEFLLKPWVIYGKR